MDRRILIGGGVLLVGLLLLILTMTAWGPGRPDAGVDLPSGVETAVKGMLSSMTGVPVEEIDVASAQEKEWPDACLGLAEQDEMCAQVVTPGWEVTLRAQGQNYLFRTNGDGAVVRMKE
jgi:hypothetical protein